MQLIQQMRFVAVPTEPETRMLYPFYLDTDMSMAFAAALSGGVALEVESSGSSTEEQNTTSRLSAGLRLLDVLDLGGRREKARKRGLNTEQRAIRRHTEASIFINLVQELYARQMVSVAPDPASLAVGQLVSMEIGPAVAPLLRIVSQILRFLDLFAPEEMSVAPARQSSRPKPGRTTPAKAAPTAPQPALPQVPDEEGVGPLRKLFQSLKTDLELSGMTDIVVRRESGLSVILTLDNTFVTEQALEMLHTSSSTVIGKVTQVWPLETDFVNLYRRSVLSLVPALPIAMGQLVLQMLATAGKSVDITALQRQTNDMLGVEPPPEEQPEQELRIGDDFQAMFPGLLGPAVQILPFAVCA